VARTVCERCGEPLPAAARFCPNCGASVDALPAEERKVVTVIFVDLVGSTQLSAQIDPERYREVIAAFYRAVSEELTSLRGQAYNFAGDAVVGVFGIPMAHDDDALLAVRAGLALVDRIGDVGTKLGVPVPLRVRVGINTGPVAIGSEPSAQGLLFGATVNLAARLQQAADPGTVLVAERTWLLTRAHVEYGEPREVSAKGFDDVARAWPVVALAPGTARRTIPFVDRKRELRLLHDTFEGALETRRGHLVTLFGEPGIGKSRVADEFLAGLPEGTRILRGRASRYAEDLAFAPLAEMILHELGEEPTAPADRLLARLQDITSDCCPADEVEVVVARLGLALGLGEDGRGGGRRFHVAEIRAGLLALLEGFGRAGAVVIVLENAHQAQASMLELMEQVVREARRIPLLVLCVARYELLEERPEWGGGLGDSLNLYLEPMSHDSATVLARQAAEGIDEATADRIARHAGGNPLFIVETTGMLRHAEGHLPSDTDSLPEQLLPPTVQAVIASRIDHLNEPARDLIRKASVFARTSFRLADLAVIADPDPEVMRQLEDEELLVRDAERPDVWRFRHGLFRDVAYETLPKRERQRLHLRLANQMGQDPATAARYPRAIAFHVERAARSALDLNPRDRELAERAVDALAHAGDVALYVSDTRAAADLYGRAIALCGPERGWGPREATVLSHLGESRYWQGEFDGATSVLHRALELAPGNAEVRAQAARFLGDIELSVRGDSERAAELFDDALTAARELGDPWTIARTLLVAGWAPYHRDDLDAARAMFQEALEVARANPEGDPWSESRALVMLASIVSSVGDEEEGLALVSQGLVIAESTKDRFSVATAREGVAGALRRMGKVDEAIGHADAAVEGFRELGARWELASSLTSRGNLHRLAGRGEEAVRDLREAHRLCRDLNERSLATWAARSLARALADAGEPAEARRALAEAESMVIDGADADGILDAEAEVLLAEGDREGALGKARELLARRRELGYLKEIAAQVWWIARVFGEEEAGGPEEVERARKTHEELHFGQALLMPELVLARGAAAP
jgi:class 3 adenylate cyclase/tetratricopeptide (TPR) repeat protein